MGMIGPIPARVDGTVKAELLGIIDTAVAGGWSAAKACSVLGLDRQRAWRWDNRRQAGLPFEDTVSGGNPIHGLLDWEQTEILAIFNEWADVGGIVVLYPQVKASNRGNYLSPHGFNPEGCWDFWGYTQPVALISRQVTNMASQMLAVRAMIGALQR